jgi:raffinose/stachyose/melibiose transport system permease protein
MRELLNIKNPRKTAIFHTAMITYSLFYVTPLFWMIMSSFKGNGEIFQDPLGLPKTIDLSVFPRAFKAAMLDKLMVNSIITTAASSTIILIASSMAAFAFSRLAFKGSKFYLGILTIGLIVPVQSYFIAQNQIVELLHMKDTRLALILPYAGMGMALAVWLLKSYIDSLPKELFEAARVDGCGDLRMYLNIVLPVLRPGLATVAVFSFLSAWNEFLLAIIYIQREDLKTIPSGLLTFSQKYVTDYQMLFAALTIITIPMITVYIIFNRQVVSGLTEGSLK